MTRKRIWSCIIAAVITLSQPIATLARAPIATLTGLAVTADVIVVAKVERTTVMSITYWGQGRIPIREEGGKALVFLGIQEDCIKVVADGAVTKLQRKPSIGTLEVRELEKRVSDILREERATCNSLSNVA